MKDEEEHMCRKIITLFMIATMALSMVACGDSGKNEAVNQTESTTDVTTEPSEENAEWTVFCRCRHFIC